jgi:ankyrin repeat protein
VVRFLLEKGADQTVKDDDEKTPYQLAKAEGHDQCVSLLDPKSGGGGGGGEGGGGCCVLQ